MSKIINSTYVTLDGVIEAPQDWPSLGSFSDEGNKIQSELLEHCDAVVMGRHTYDGFAPVWPTLAGDPFANRMNALPKYVVSTTLTDPEWNNTILIAESPVETIRGIKDQSDGDLVQYGFGQLSHALMAEALIDELRLWVHPFFVGTDRVDDTLSRVGSTAHFALSDVTKLENGVVLLTYQASPR